MSKQMARPEKKVNPIDVARVIGELGGTDEQLAKALGITRQALAVRKKKDPQLFDTLKKAKTEADARVEKALYERATGYTCEDCHVSQYEGVITITPIKKHYPPDPVSMIFWLKNRRPQQWREKSEADITLRGMPEDLVKAIQERAAAKAKTNGTTDQTVRG
jgi:hypothetical protein